MCKQESDTSRWRNGRASASLRFRRRGKTLEARGRDLNDAAAAAAAILAGTKFIVPSFAGPSAAASESPGDLHGPVSGIPEIADTRPSPNFLTPFQVTCSAAALSRAVARSFCSCRSPIALFYSFIRSSSRARSTSLSSSSSSFSVSGFFSLGPPRISELAAREIC